MPEEEAKKLTINPVDEMLKIMRGFDALKTKCIDLIDVLTKELASKQGIKKKSDGSAN